MKEALAQRGGLEYVGLMISTLSMVGRHLGLDVPPVMPITELCAGIKAKIEQQERRSA